MRWRALVRLLKAGTRGMDAMIGRPACATVDLFADSKLGVRLLIALHGKCVLSNDLRNPGLGFMSCAYLKLGRSALTPSPIVHVCSLLLRLPCSSEPHGIHLNSPALLVPRRILPNIGPRRSLEQNSTDGLS